MKFLVVTIPALDQNNNMRTTLKVERFEAAYQKAVKEVKEILTCLIESISPGKESSRHDFDQSTGKNFVLTLIFRCFQNPEANYFTLEELKPIIEWSMKRRLFVILDKIYDMTIYDEVNQKA